MTSQSLRGVSTSDLTMVRDALAQVKRKGFAKVSGGKGVHVVVALKPCHTWDEVKKCLKTVDDVEAKRMLPSGAVTFVTNTGSRCSPSAAKLVYAEAMSSTLTAFEPIAVERYGASSDFTPSLAASSTTRFGPTSWMSCA